MESSGHGLLSATGGGRSSDVAHEFEVLRKNPAGAAAAGPTQRRERSVEATRFEDEEGVDKGNCLTDY